MVVIVGLIVAFVLIAIFSNRATRACRWREYRHSDTEATWSCVFCGAKTTGKPGETPKSCFRNNA
ncbi:hypothetical protein [Roseivivax sediminis]|uniref:Uncharacterized protein n=1 Tax=Roseivivax sediminis TaxID=936889 RepID=A0A1I1ZFD3_9RHOB|nr:hypothetical protein [Roseivivax sediminis]SFE30466.1 hypothetical protein SAMN04515678_108124 [Roseivivax sediminis]